MIRRADQAHGDAAFGKALERQQRLLGGVHLAQDSRGVLVQALPRMGEHLAAPDHRLEQFEDALAVARLDLVHVLKLLRVEAGALIAFGRRRQQRAGLVEHADRFRIHLGHAARHQVDDAGDLRAVERAPRVQRQQHRGAGLLLLAKESVLVRQREVHARVLHRGERGDRARELAFEAALEGEALLELSLAEADDRALGQAGRGHLQPHVVDLGSGHQDGRAAVGMLVGHVHLRQLGDDRAAVLVGQVGVQHFVVALAAPHRHREHHADEGGEAEGERQLALRRQRRQARTEAAAIGERVRVLHCDCVVHRRAHVRSGRR